VIGREIVNIDPERRLVSARHHQAELEIVNAVLHTMRLVFNWLVTASVSNDQDGGLGMNLDVYERVFAVNVVLGDQDGRRVEPLRGEGTA
jgi:uncharacterized membrane protein YhdT